MTDEESFEPGKGLDRLENTYCALATNPIILEPQNLQAWFIRQHLGKLRQNLIVEIVVIKEDLLKGFVVHESI